MQVRPSVARISSGLKPRNVRYSRLGPPACALALQRAVKLSLWKPRESSFSCSALTRRIHRRCHTA
jgi:hypothetical protein